MMNRDFPDKKALPSITKPFSVFSLRGLVRFEFAQLDFCFVDWFLLCLLMFGLLY